MCTGWGTYPGACFGSVFQEQAPSCVPAFKPKGWERGQINCEGLIDMVTAMVRILTLHAYPRMEIFDYLSLMTIKERLVT